MRTLLETSNYIGVRDFFTKNVYEKIASKKAKLIFSIAMFYHLNDPMKFAKDVSDCLDDEGVWIIQMAYLPAMIRTNMYDNIVHEHAGYYGVVHMKWIMEEVGLEVFDIEENDVYGGSFRIFVKKKGNEKFPLTERYAEILKKEIDAAWTVEPWVSLLEHKAGAKVFLEEADLWANRKKSPAPLLFP